MSLWLRVLSLTYSQRSYLVLLWNSISLSTVVVKRGKVFGEVGSGT